MRLQGKVVLVVGAGEHLGRSAPLLFAQEGAKVVIAARRQSVLEETAEMIRAKGGEVTIHVGSNITGFNTISASSGYGEMNVLVPGGVEARIKVNQGNVIVDSTFIKIDDSTYDTPGYQDATDKVEITVGSGAGEVNVIRK